MPERVRNWLSGEGCFIFAQPHFADAVVEFFSRLLGLDERVFGLLFVVDVDFGEALPGADECAEEFEFVLKGCAFRRTVAGLVCGSSGMIRERIIPLRCPGCIFGTAKAVPFQSTTSV